MQFFRSFVLCCLLPLAVQAQEKPNLRYYLPNVQYRLDFPTPAQYLGFEIGEWHASHDQLVGYLRELDRLSDRITIQEYGRSHEQRPMLCLTVTAPENQARLADIRQSRRLLADPTRSAALDANALPAVAYMGYSIHGNEASGSNAALLLAYYLAAAQTPQVDSLLKHVVILLDPSFNPDGMQRFSSWVNSRRSQALMPDPGHDEFNEPWPGGRTNHYWFDLNRDWLVAQQPESVGRVAIFQDWLPNTLTDHHEMGSNSTFFFQPGVPSRVNPLTPARNQALTAKIAQYHARFLSEKKVLFYSEENFDDFYYGKGSTYPDVNGCVGILFEQASSRGSAQETENGLLTFPYTIRNQVITSLSTLQAVSDLRVELNTYLRDFYQSALDEARQDAAGWYLFGDTSETRPTREFLRLLARHRIEVRPVLQDISANGQRFVRGQAWAIPAEQPAYRLVKAIFQRETTFADSIFYDISAWTLPDAFGLPWTTAERRAVPATALGPALAASDLRVLPEVPAPGPDTYAFAVESEAYDLPRLLAALHRASIRVKAATRAFVAEGQRFAVGSLLIPLEKQPQDAAGIQRLIQNCGASDIRVHLLRNGLTPEGPDLGSNNMVTLRAPKVILVTGRGANAADAGEVWHLLDTRYGLSPLQVDASRLGNLNLSKYNVVVLADGNFNGIPSEKLRSFVSEGGTLVATGSSLRWLKNNGLLGLEFRNMAPEAKSGRRPYSELSDDRGALGMPGAIFEVELDLSNPVCYGYARPRIPMFQGDTIFVETAQNPYATPAVFSAKPLLAGYVHERQRKLLPGAAAIVVGGLGRGRIICFSGNPNFRAFWYGTNRLFANAVFFGNLISDGAVERK
ncbi:MAG: zinc carboxypeptidase [Saprospiraceae bacterium]|nr:zinc carboxypeptidase [Saprospiraceae bacterium]